MGKAASVVAVSLALMALASDASATTYAPVAEPRPFCAAGQAPAGLPPFRPQPRLRVPSPSGQLGFGPGGLRLNFPPLPLVIRGGSVGYSLSLRPAAPAAHLGWLITSTLSKVDRQGREARWVEIHRDRVESVRPGRSLRVRFRVSREPAFYRVVSLFRDHSGRKLGQYGFFFRVLPAVEEQAHLVLNARSYRPGDIAFGRIDNLGSVPIYYGTPFAMDRFAGADWIVAPESPDGPWLMPLLGTRPGQAGQCHLRFRLPAEMSPGRYRFEKEVGIGESPRRYNPTKLYAEFDVLP